MKLEQALISKFAERHGGLEWHLDENSGRGYIRFRAQDVDTRAIKIHFIFREDVLEDCHWVKVGAWSDSAARKWHPARNIYQVLERRWAEFERKIGLRAPRGGAVKRRDVAEESVSRGQKNACAVSALAHAADVSFEDADAFWRLYGARNSDTEGTLTLMGLAKADPHHQGREYRLDLLGVRFVREHWGGNLGRLIPRIPKGRYFVRVRRHALAIVDGVCVDSGRTRPLARVVDIFRVEKLA